jgi:hypothetical protein
MAEVRNPGRDDLNAVSQFSTIGTYQRQDTLLTQNGQDVACAQDQQLLPIDIDFLANIVAENHAVALLDFRTSAFTAGKHGAIADAQNPALLRLLSGSVWQNNSARCGFFSFDTLDDDFIAEGNNVHDVLKLLSDWALIAPSVSDVGVPAVPSIQRWSRHEFNR